MINRIEFVEEMVLREHLQNTIAKTKADKRASRYEEMLKERTMRNVVKDMLFEVSVSDDNPHNSTGINKLTTLLNKVIKSLKTGYMNLEKPKERLSYRTYIINAIISTIAPPRALKTAEVESLVGTPEREDLSNVDLDGDIPVNAGTNEDAANPNMINLEEGLLLEILGEQEGTEVGPPEADASEEEGGLEVDGTGQEDPSPENMIDIDEKPKDLAAEEPENVDHGLDRTGRDEATEVFKHIEKDIVDAYTSLHDPEDRQIFYTYLLVNTLLYFDKFESEINPDMTIPDIPAYDKEKANAEMATQAPRI